MIIKETVTYKPQRLFEVFHNSEEWWDINDSPFPCLNRDEAKRMAEEWINNRPEREGIPTRIIKVTTIEETL